MIKSIIAIVMLFAGLAGAQDMHQRMWDWMEKAVDDPSMITTWNLTVDDAAGKTITLPLRGGFDYDFVVDWGDDTTAEVTAYNDSDISHEYASTGTKTVKMTGTLGAWYFNDGGDKLKFKTVESWGDVRFAGLGLDGAFYGCVNATYFDDLPYMPITSLGYTWYNCSGLTTAPVMPLSSTALTQTAYALDSVGVGMSGTVVELWDTNNFPNITSFGNTFKGATGLANYADIPNAWKGL